MIPFLIYATTLPFLAFITKVDFSLFGTDPQWFWYDISGVMGSITGFIGTVLLFWSTILGVKFVVRYLSDDIIGVNKIHQFIGKYGIILVFSHIFLTMYSYMENLLWIIIPSIENSFALYVSFGRFALYLYVIIWITSALLKSKMKYRPWLYIHYFTYPLTFFAILHAINSGTFTSEYSFIRFFWFFMLFSTAFVGVYRIAKWAGFFKSQYVVSGREDVGDDIVVFTLSHRSGQILLPEVGQYFYLQIGRYKEAHPFTVLGYDEKTQELLFGIKALGNFTREMFHVPKGSTLFVDGPYGVFTKEAHNSDPRVIIAGGIGIAPFVDLVKKYPQADTIFIHCNPYFKNIVRRDELIGALGDKYLDLISREKVSIPGVYCSRINSRIVEDILNKHKAFNRKFFICGSVRFTDGVVEILQQIGIPRRNIYYEEFSF